MVKQTKGVAGEWVAQLNRQAEKQLPVPTLRKTFGGLMRMVGLRGLSEAGIWQSLTPVAKAALGAEWDDEHRRIVLPRLGDLNAEDQRPPHERLLGEVTTVMLSRHSPKINPQVDSRRRMGFTRSINSQATDNVKSRLGLLLGCGSAERAPFSTLQVDGNWEVFAAAPREAHARRASEVLFGGGFVVADSSVASTMVLEPFGEDNGAGMLTLEHSLFTANRLVGAQRTETGLRAVRRVIEVSAHEYLAVNTNAIAEWLGCTVDALPQGTLEGDAAELMALVLEQQDSSLAVPAGVVMQATQRTEEVAV